MTFLSGDQVLNLSFIGQSPSYPSAFNRLDQNQVPGYLWQYGPGATDARYFLNFDRVPSWGLDSMVARYTTPVMTGPAITLGSVVYRWHSNDSAGSTMRLCAFLRDGGVEGAWDTLPYLFGEVTRNTVGSVGVRIGWVNGAGEEVTLDNDTTNPYLDWALSYSRLFFFRTELVDGVWVARCYLCPEEEDAVPATSHDPEGAVLVLEAEIPAAILALSGHNSVGFLSGTTGVPGFPTAYSGLVPLTFQMWQEAIPIAPCSLLLRIYDDDGLTVRWQVSTDPNHPTPYLMPPSFYASQELDVATGGATIGTVTVGVVDPMAVAEDQDGGWMTARLAWATIADIQGRRCELLRFISDAVGYQVIADGPAGAPELDPSYSAYVWPIRDTRETERKLRLFQTVPRALVPGEHVEGYGVQPGPIYLSEPLRGLRGRVTRASGYPNPSYIEVAVGWSLFPANGRRILLWQATYDAINRGIGRTARQSSGDSAVGAAWQATAVALDVSGQRVTNPLFSFHWRPLGSTGAYTEIPGEFLAISLSTVDSTTTEGSRVLGRIVVEDLRLNDTLSTYNAGAPALPDTDDDIDFFLMGVVAPDEQHPFPIDGITAGEFLQNMYDGQYSERDPLTGAVVPTGIRYDAAALAQMTTPVQLLIKEPVEDGRSWSEEKFYGPTGWVPALDALGRISPISRIPPADTSLLPALTDSNCQPAPTWRAGDRVINILRFKYFREYYLSHPDLPSIQPSQEHRQSIVGQREIAVEWVDPASVARHGERVLELDGTAFNAVGLRVVTDTEEALLEPVQRDRPKQKPGLFVRSRRTPQNEDTTVETGVVVSPLSGLTIADETGYQLADLAQRYLLARYRFGAPTLSVAVRRVDVPTVRAGDWLVIDLSWMPDYVTGRRGLLALGQVVALGELDCQWRQVTVEVVTVPDLGS